MTRRSRRLGGSLLMLALGGASLAGQIEPWDQKFSRGQTVVPVYEGWERNPDGSATMVFGYLNRNYIEEPTVPIGPANSFSPGAADRGQPEHFGIRRNFFVFRVNVPNDWGDKELLWTLTSNGKTETAHGNLHATWEIDRLVQVSNDGGAGGADEGTIDKNTPPKVVVAPVQPVAVSGKLMLAATVTDDGLPKVERRRRPAVGQETPPTLKYKGEPSPVNVPLPTPSKAPQGLSIAWVHYRGAGQVAIEPGGYTTVKDGKATATATFSRPGRYVLRAIASDGMLKTPSDVTVIVNPPAK